LPTSQQNSQVRGAAPEGAADERAAAAAVQKMFTDIAPRYDLLNHVLSFNVDRIWWRRAARTFVHILKDTELPVLDLCCGTGDMTDAVHCARTEAFFARNENVSTRMAPIIGIDFAHAMLVRAAGKYRPVVKKWVEADALQLPLADASVYLVTSAFGFRNLANYDSGLREIYRVLAPEGEVGILDFGEPGGIVGKFYAFYFRHVLPKAGTLISGVRGPYAYLPASVKRFPPPNEMLERMRAAGFRDVSWTPYTFGIAGLYRGKK
jgi:demethylmenaquinone methyltransferase/2-methoxy-6-polyprenyl-1,4-benzoquinol methylase